MSPMMHAQGVAARPLLADAYQHVLTMRRVVAPSAVPTFVRRALHEIRVHIEDHHLDVRGEAFSICHSTTPDGVDVEAGWPVAQAVGTARISSGVMPVTLVRSSRGHAESVGAGSIA